MDTIAKSIQTGLIFQLNDNTKLFVCLKDCEPISCSIETLDHGAHAKEQPEQTPVSWLSLIIHNPTQFRRFLVELDREIVHQGSELHSSVPTPETQL